jgi:hypothetical protein
VTVPDRRSLGGRPWLWGALTALLVVGPALGPGLLLNLDLVATADPPLPSGVWGLGPELPRGIPYQVPLVWLGNLLDGALVAKGVMVLVLMVAFVGAHRLAAGAADLSRIAAGLVYAAGPFLATRLAIGHVGTGLAMALLPWALPTLLRPSTSRGRTLLWCAALGACGINGGLLAGAVVAVGLVADRGRRAASVLGVALIGQLPWLVPGLVVTLQGVDPAGAENFATRLDGPLGLLRLVGGQGYFIGEFDVGDGSYVVPVAALALLVGALLGRRRLPDAWGPRAGALALAALAVAAASGLPLLDDLYRAAADTPVGLPLREGHRMLPLFLVWLAPAAAHGAERLRPRVDGMPLVVLGAALLLVSSSLWGFGGQVDPVERPPEWAEARRAVDREPGPVLALPFTQYVRPNVIDTHLVHQPLPSILGGDVILASGRGEAGVVERADPRLGVAAAAVEDLRAREDPSDDLGRIGVRWLAVLDTADPSFDDLDAIADGGLEVVVDGPSLTLYRVGSWPGAATDEEGRAAEVDPVVSPWARVAGAEAVTWFRPGADGWLRGWDRAHTTVDGNLALPAGGGPVLHWPSLLVLLADGITVGAVIVVLRRHR